MGVESGKIRSILTRCLNADLEFIGTARSLDEKRVSTKKKRRKKKKTILRTFVVKGKEKTYRCLKILVWKPESSDEVPLKPNHLQRPKSYSCSFSTEAVPGEEIFEIIPIKEKILQKLDTCRSEKNSILRTNNRRKEKRVINTPNRRRISHLAATQIRAAI